MNQIYGLPKWFVPVFRILVVIIAGLVVLGGSVRVMNAGLACPDWPLCYGNVIPDFHPQVYFEFIHRVVAGLVSIGTILLQTMLFKSSAPRKLKNLGILSLVLLLSQVVLGGLTVLLQLKAGVVASHLAFGTGFFAVMLWISLELKRAQKSQALKPIAPFVPGWTGLVLLVVYGQMILGGLVASNYAALACTDFPKCQGQWIPSLQGPVGIHVIHRFGAYTVALIAILSVILLSKSTPFFKKQSRMFLGIVVIQIGLGISNVLFYIPPIIAILHLAIALKLLYVAVRLWNVALASPRSA